MSAYAPAIYAGGNAVAGPIYGAAGGAIALTGDNCAQSNACTSGALRALSSEYTIARVTITDAALHEISLRSYPLDNLGA
jgi:hypothetical protein